MLLAQVVLGVFTGAEAVHQDERHLHTLQFQGLMGS